ncbi:MAG: GNAT family N-acetyltransferase [Anaerolineae bacterium]|nr:GNAT family N-acetyltransferase [Anaerolineae bacterium]
MAILALVPASHFSLMQLASLVSRAYADYYYHVSVTEAQLAQICREEDVELSESVVALYQDEPVGLALLSLRADRGWISAVGVLPEFRRQGAARALILYLQRRARSLQLHSVTLEVLAQNRPGLALYAQLGFVHSRELLLMILEPNSFALETAPLTSIVATPPNTLLTHFEACHSVPASWQRDLPTLRHRLSHLAGLGYWEQGVLLGYVLYQPQRTYQIIHDLGVTHHAAHPWVIAQHLLQAVHQQRPAAGGYVINVVAEDPLVSAYRAVHYRTIHRQYELLWKPDGDSGCGED